MDDRAQVEQSPIMIQYVKTGLLEGQEIPQEINVPAPPDGCESQQLMDFGSVSSIFGNSFNIDIKLRAAEAYAMRWGIEIKKVYGGGHTSL